MKYITGLIIALLIGACSGQSQTPTTSSSTSTSSNVPIGAYNPDVSQATIKQTICVVGYTKTIRVRLPTRKGYEHDHFIPLELGGDPTNPNNLWYVPNNRAHDDDSIENKLHREVCSGKLTLREAQNEIIQEKSH